MAKVFRIRQLAKTDAGRLEGFLRNLGPRVIDLWNRFGYAPSDFDPKKVACVQCALSRRNERGFVALNHRSEIAAYSYLRFFPEKKRKAHNASLGIVVLPKYQNEGLGRRLMLEMHRWASENGIKKIWLATYSRNKAAIRMYRSLGYSVEGIFMYDELAPSGWDHVVSMAFMLDKKLKDAASERRRLMATIER